MSTIKLVLETENNQKIGQKQWHFPSLYAKLDFDSCMRENLNELHKKGGGVKRKGYIEQIRHCSPF